MEAFAVQALRAYLHVLGFEPHPYTGVREVIEDDDPMVPEFIAHIQQDTLPQFEAWYRATYAADLARQPPRPNQIAQVYYLIREALEREDQGAQYYHAKSSDNEDSADDYDMYFRYLPNDRWEVFDWYDRYAGQWRPVEENDVAQEVFNRWFEPAVAETDVEDEDDYV